MFCDLSIGKFICGPNDSEFMSRFLVSLLNGRVSPLLGGRAWNGHQSFPWLSHQVQVLRGRWLGWTTGGREADGLTVLMKRIHVFGKKHLSIGKMHAGTALVGVFRDF